MRSQGRVNENLPPRLARKLATLIKDKHQVDHFVAKFQRSSIPGEIWMNASAMRADDASSRVTDEPWQSRITSLTDVMRLISAGIACADFEARVVDGYTTRRHLSLSIHADPQQCNRLAEKYVATSSATRSAIKVYQQYVIARWWSLAGSNR